MHAELIDIREAWKSYHIEEVEIPAVRGVSLVIPAGQFVAITGASGSGKSTFMHVLGCLDRLDRGQYFFEGQPIERYSRRQLAQLRNRRIGSSSRASISWREPASLITSRCRWLTRACAAALGAARRPKCSNASVWATG